VPRVVDHHVDHQEPLPAQLLNSVSTSDHHAYHRHNGQFCKRPDMAKFLGGVDVSVFPYAVALSVRRRCDRLDRHSGHSINDVSEQRLDVLTNVMIARAFPELLGIPVVIFEREIRDFSQVFRIQFHVRSNHTDSTRKTECLHAAKITPRSSVILKFAFCLWLLPARVADEH
jgi:hypothetical protein